MSGKDKAAKLNKKISTIVITAVCLFAMAVAAVGYMLKEGIINKDNLFIKNDADSTKAEVNNTNTDEMLSNAFLKEGAECYLDCGLKIDEVRPIYFKFNSLSVSKEVGDFDFRDDYEWGEIRDENGTITNEYSYVICNFTIINKGETSHETTLNNLLLYYGEKSASSTGSNGSLYHSTNAWYTEARSYNSHKTDTPVKQYFYFTFEPNEEHNFNIVYIVRDDIIEEYKSEMLIFISFIEPNWCAEYPVIEKK